MADNTKIEWCDATWNPVTGCSVISPGCTNCYAMKLAGTRMKHHPSRAGLTNDSNAGPVWNGVVRLNEGWLDQPLKWSKPRRIFVCAHGDLFHEKVPDEWIDRIFAVMALAPQHTFMVLTKRAARMREYLAHRARPDYISVAATHQWDSDGDMPPEEWPLLPNVWLGVSVEDQARADERIPHLLATPAAKRFISAEPLLGPIDLDAFLAGDLAEIFDPATRLSLKMLPPRRLNWAIAGGESGPNARPMHPDWARSLRDQCQMAGVAYFFKQWGEWEPRTEWSGHLGSGRFETMRSVMLDGSKCPDDVAPQDIGAHRMARVGKKGAGRLLDALEWSEFPA